MRLSLAFVRLPPMDEIHLLNQTLGNGCGPPSIEQWTQLCREASDEELLRLRSVAIDCLSADGGETERWSVYVGIVEGTLRERGI
jgi:hypothetical protein